MGLDMYLEGHKFVCGNGQKDKSGYPIKNIELQLGYWRKHPNLHGYIVNTFADGKDECQAIELGEEEINQIIEAITEDALPPTSGFFFGASDGSEKKSDLAIFNAALEWLNEEEAGYWKHIEYRASW